MHARPSEEGEISGLKENQNHRETHGNHLESLV